MLLIALATASKQLRVIRVAVHWGLPQSEKQLPAASMPLNPSLKEKHVAVSSWLQSNPNESHLDPSMAQLSHLEILPSILESSSQKWAAPVVLAVRSYLPGPNSPYQEVQSVIDRWEVMNDQPEGLHSAFEQLGSRRNSTGSAPPVSFAVSVESVCYKLIRVRRP
jgi:mediator of RNA polymerase II transcription subunit 16, fungi type